MDDGDKVLTDKNDYLNITIFDCLSRIKQLEHFKALLISYRDGNVPKSGFQTFRSNISQKITIIEEYVATSYTPVQIGYKFPGSMEHVQVAMYRELFNNRFNGHIIQAAIDHLDMAIGRYNNVRFKSIMHTVSPLYWLKRFSFWLSCTFAELFNVEINSKKFSWINFIVQIVMFLSAIAAIYSALVTYFGKPTLWF